MVTVTTAVPILPSLVAVMVAVPAETPVTTPVPDTLAMFVALEDHVTTRPVRTLPDASVVVAPNETVLPTSIVAVDGVTATVATGTWVTVTTVVPLWPSLVAVIVALPAAIPVTMPVADTVAIELSLLAQPTTRPRSVFPLPSFVVADRVNVWPTTTLAGDGDTVTLATGTCLMLIAADP